MAETNLKHNNDRVESIPDAPAEVTAIDRTVGEIGARAKKSATLLAQSSNDQRDQALHAAAAEIRARSEDIIEQNERDVAEATGLSAPLVDRLKLSKQRVEAMATGLEDITR
ncbi:MAG: hypothetical protein AAGC83_12675, partial [Pseudomonadota bacterium]